MDYILLPLLDNKYPSFRNYTKTGESKVTLYGIYRDVNKHEFTVPSIDNIKVVPNTSFRFILSIKKTNDDLNPVLYTSDLFYSDLQDSIDSNNPYLARFALLDASIVKISLQDSIDLFAKLEPLEKDVPVAVIKNIFASGKDKNGKTAESTKAQLGAKRVQLDDLKDKLTKLDENISNDDKIVNQNNFLSFLRRTNKNSVSAELVKLKADREATSVAIKALETEINSISGAGKAPTTPGAEPNTFAKPAIPDVTLTANDIDIDYDILVRYIDWMVSKNTYSIDTAETGGVIASEKIGEWAGDLIDNYKERLAKKEAARLESLGSGSLSTSGSTNNIITPATPTQPNTGGSRPTFDSNGRPIFNTK